MASVLLTSVVCLVFCVLCIDHSQSEVHGFPLNNCHQDPIDLFFVATFYLPYDDFSTQLQIFTLIAKVFLSPEDVSNSRVRIAVAQDADDWRYSKGVPMFREYNLDNQMEADAAIMSVTPFQTPMASHRSAFDALDLAENGFAIRGARSDAVHVAVVIHDQRVNRIDLDHIKYVQKRGYVEDGDIVKDRNVERFVFIIDQEMNSIHRYLPFENTALIQNVSYLLKDTRLPMVLCKQCSQGWIPFHHTKGEYSMSCYKLDIAPTKIDWLKAQERSGNDFHANLACTELKEELEYLQGQILSLLDKKDDEIQTYDDTGNGNVMIYIGLNRNMKTLHKRFRWTLGFDKQRFPLTITNWLPRNPDGGHAQACGVWLFYRLSESISTPETLQNENQTEYYYHYENQTEYYYYYENQTEYYHDTFQIREGWKDTGCGNPLTRFSLFEALLPRIPVAYPVFLKASPVNSKSYKIVSRSKEISEYQEKLVSVASYLKDNEFRAFLKTTSNPFPMFNCGEGETQSTFISYSEVCDRVDHCPNRRDEYICHYRSCTTSEFQCKSGLCIDSDGRCDIFVDCPDGSDEEDCVECRGYRCCDGACLPLHWVRDGEVDCFCNRDTSYSAGFGDELPSLFESGSTNGQADDVCVFVCNRTNCVYPYQLADSVTDCVGPEGPLDKTLGRLQRADSCFDNMGRTLWAPRCVYVKDRYGSVLGCRDLSHLLRCEDFECQEGYIKCPNSYCIPLHFVQNGIEDCPMGEDEMSILDEADRDCRGNFLCWGSKVCVHPDLVCDGHPHCQNGDDELNCHVTCPKGFKCIAGTITVSDYDKSVPLLNLSEFDPLARYIDLSGIDMSDAYSADHLTNLVEVVFSNCSLKDPYYIIRGFETVYMIDLSYNLIEYIHMGKPRPLFGGMKNLRILNLSHNYNLASIGNTGFDWFGYNDVVLEVLDLSYTSIATLSAATFESMVNLKTLNLTHTLITDLNRAMFPAKFRLQRLDLRLTPITSFEENSFNGLHIDSDLYTDHSGLCCPQMRGMGIPAHTCHAPNDAISSCYDMIDSEVQRIILWLMAVVAVVGNVTVVVYRLVWDRDILNRAYGLFVTNLAVSDLIMGIYLLIIACADVHYRNVYVWNDRTWRHSLVCKVSGFLGTFSSETSVFFIFLVTLDRYLVIKYPYGQIRFSKVVKVLAVILAWSVGFILALIPTLSIFSGENTIFSSNSVCLGLPLTTKHQPGWGYSFSVFIVLNFVMFVVIALGQVAIFNAMSGNRVEEEASNQGSSRLVQDIQVAKQLSLIVLSDFLCWFPVGLMGLLTLGGTEISPNAFAWTAVLVLPVNAALNPILYTIPVLMARWEKFKTGAQQRRR